jgi:NitT/TauT family transport system permease protein
MSDLSGKPIYERITGWFQIREPVPRKIRFILGVIPIICGLIIWIFLTTGEAEERVISPLILPSPFEVASSLKSLWFEAELSRSLAASMLRVVAGFLVGLLISFPLGLMMGSFSKVRAMFEPASVFGAYLPIPTLVPLTMSLFGIGEFQKVMFLSIAFFVYLLPMFVKAVDDVDNVYLQTAYTLGATRWQTLRRVLLGISLPKIFHAMRLGFGIGWSYIILAEMVAANRGLGAIIIIAQRRGPREHIYLVLIVIVLVAYLTDKLWEKAGNKLFPYK